MDDSSDSVSAWRPLAFLELTEALPVCSYLSWRLLITEQENLSPELQELSHQAAVASF